MAKLWKPGERARLLAPTLGGWRGWGTVVFGNRDADGLVVIQRDGKQAGDRCMVGSEELGR